MDTTPPPEAARDPWADAVDVHARTLALDDELGVDTGLVAVPAARPLQAPLILDTDIGGDPDDAVALTVAAGLPHLALVVTADETPDGARARFARLLLDQLGRGDVPVVQGPALSDTRYVALDGLTLPTTPLPAGPDAINSAVTAVLARAGAARWVGLGPLTTLARLITDRPDLADRLHVTQMGYALDYRHPDRAEHNVRLDVEAARTVLTACPDLQLVLSDVTFTLHLALDAEHPLTRALADSDLPWARTLTAHVQSWFARFHPETLQHDALTLSAALARPTVSFRPATVALDDIGRMSESSVGVGVRISQRAYYERFWTWLTRELATVLADPAGLSS